MLAKGILAPIPMLATLVQLAEQANHAQHCTPLMSPKSGEGCLDMMFNTRMGWKHFMHDH